MQTHYGITEMAELCPNPDGGVGITKQAMSARMDTKLFKEMCAVESTRHGRFVPIDQFDAYCEAWKSQRTAA